MLSYLWIAEDSARLLVQKYAVCIARDTQPAVKSKPCEDGHDVSECLAGFKDIGWWYAGLPLEEGQHSFDDAISINCVERFGAAKMRQSAQYESRPN